MSAGVLPPPNGDALRPRSPDGMGRGAVLALLAHALLVLALALSLRWHSQAPPTYAAELWAVTPQAAAPRAQAPPQRPAPAPAPPPTPAPAPAPAPTPAPAPPPAPPQPSAFERDAQIAIEQAKKAAAEQAERERIARQQAEKAAHERDAKERAARELAARQQAERDKAEQQRAAQEQALREQVRREKVEQAERDRLQREKAAAATAKAKEEARQKELKAQQQQKADDDRLAKLRQDNLKRMMGQVGASGAPDAAGTAARDAGPSASYAGRLIARVRPNILLTEKISGNPKADVEVRASPNGTILGRRLVKSSGNKDWDEAVLRAIDRTGELPRDVDGRVPPVLVITFTP